MVTNRERILALLRTQRVVTAGDVASVYQIPRSSAKVVLCQLVKEGVVVARRPEERNRWNGFAPTRYSLADEMEIVTAAGA